MKIILTSIGTRGDMEPFLAIGEMLLKKGHEVICAFPEQFQDLAEEGGMQFASLGREFMEMLESEDGKAALGGGGSGLKKFLAFAKLVRRQQTINKGLVRRQYEIIEEHQPDRIVHNGKAMYPLVWEVKYPGTTVMVSPVPYLHYVEGHSHLAFNSNFGPFINKLTFKIADFGLLKTIMASLKWLGITNVTKQAIKEALRQHKIIYTISPVLFPRPAYWSPNIQVLGFHERNKQLNWQPSPELQAFLARHPKIIFITFGSMTNPEPEQKTQIFLDILQRHQIPAIINTAAGGLMEPTTYDKNLIHFVSRIPYDWIFPKMYAVIHHGGSGTTHTTLKNGCATMIIPHIIDQFVWNKIVHEKGAGLLGVKIGNISVQNLESSVLALVNNSSYKERAEALKEEMGEEDFLGELYRVILSEAGCR